MPPPWPAHEIAATLAQRGTVLLEAPEGFLIGRIVAGEAEILTLAVDPDRRRQGVGSQLTGRFMAWAEAAGATRAFLDVAAGNLPAIGLYRSLGFAEIGRRKDYYRAAGGSRDDAVLMAAEIAVNSQNNLPIGQ
ncbi:MAG: GNAT family N-acetyltransferase [Rhodobacteraceae bacterium]|nr:GNAT family N-acetyltransferase [Paracoccaceae bacterium]